MGCVILYPPLAFPFGLIIIIERTISESFRCQDIFISDISDKMFVSWSGGG